MNWLKKLRFRRLPSSAAEQPGMITRTCRICGKTFTLPGNVQYWPDCCQECRAKLPSSERVTRTCRSCGKSFTFPSDIRPWPKICSDCRNQRKHKKKERK